MKHTQGKVVLMKLVKLLDCDGECQHTPALVDCPSKCPRTFMDESESEVLYELPDGMTTEEAIKYLEHGPEMVALIKSIKESGTRICGYSEEAKRKHAMVAAFDETDRWARNLLTKLEGKELMHMDKAIEDLTIKPELEEQAINIINKVKGLEQNLDDCITVLEHVVSVPYGQPLTLRDRDDIKTLLKEVKGGE